MDRDELRFRTQHSPPHESTINPLVSPPRNGTRLTQPVVSNDHRTTLPRRFTTDSGRVPTLATISNVQSKDFTSYQKVQLIEKKRQEYEHIREQNRILQAEMARLEKEQRALAQDVPFGEELHHDPFGGHQSEPTTPPERLETSAGFPTMFSRPNRYSTSSLTSPPSLFNRTGRSGSQLASPQSGIMQSRFAYDDHLPFRSVPGSRRNSDEDDKEEAVRQDPTSHRATNALNRYSMPVTRSRTGFYDNHDPSNTTRFLFGDDEPTQDSKFAQDSTPDDSFPTLLRHDKGLSAIASNQINGTATSAGSGSSYRRSLDLKHFSDNLTESASLVSPSGGHIMATPPKLQNSYSTGDVPTVKGGSGAQNFPNTNNQAAQQHLHNHNASLGRIPAGAMHNRHSRELSHDGSAMASRDQASTYPSIHSALHGNAPSFGPTLAGPAPSQNSAVSNPASASAYPGYYVPPNFAASNGTAASAISNYTLPMISMNMQNMSLNGYSNPSMGSYASSVYNGPLSQRDSQSRIIQNRRQQETEAMNRFVHMPLEAVMENILSLSKDQHGCRYLQKKLDERNPATTHAIWEKTHSHVVDLMTDPFGNYLCQKLLENCNAEERTALVRNAQPEMVKIALNQHGTRALQRMIEFISGPVQTQLVIEALQFDVVALIKDLNGNHVIQKCLNKLPPEDAQFIFDAVGHNCVEVGTHRHGCCVIQRCIDHANRPQQRVLIQQITNHAHILVQDPFGNYVVQYIIDLNQPEYTEPVVAQFRTRIGQLSRHKFSSNVIEKCLRCARDVSKDMIVDELLVPGEMEKFLKDSFANYVVQTALDTATQARRQQLIDTIRPLLPGVRNTPHGRRLQSKITSIDSCPGQSTPTDATLGQRSPPRQPHHRGMSNGNNGLAPAPSYGNGMPATGIIAPRGNPASFGFNGLAIGAPQHQRMPPAPSYGFPPPASTNGAPPLDHESHWL